MGISFLLLLLRIKVLTCETQNVQDYVNNILINNLCCKSFNVFSTIKVKIYKLFLIYVTNDLFIFICIFSLFQAPTLQLSFVAFLYFYLSLCLSVSLSLCLSMSLSLCISLSTSLCISLSTSLCLSVSLSLCTCARYSKRLRSRRGK